MLRLISTILLFTYHLAFSAQSEPPPVLDQIEIIGEVDSGWEYWLLQQQSCESDDVCELFRRAARDSFLRILYVERGAAVESETASFFDVAPTAGELSAWLNDSDRSNQAWLSSRVENKGWFEISRYGEDADMAAFLIVQHADFDREFQKRMLTLLEGLLKESETRPNGWAMLHDRVSVAEGRPQRFGSQGRCVDIGVWEPFEIENLDDLDALRAAHDFMTMDNYKQRLGNLCANVGDR